jgi:dTMP kinase
MAGKFIVFEGITGSGKKNNLVALADRLRDFGFSVALISFPDYEGEIARLAKRTQSDPFTLSLLYAADRTNDQDKIKEMLENNKIVLCDRYCYSNFAYQAAHGIPLHWLMEIEGNILKPDIVFYIDTPPELSMKRVQQSSLEDFTKDEILSRIEREKQIIEKIRETYLYLAKNDKESKWYVIDGTKEVSDTIEEIWKVIQDELE